MEVVYANCFGAPERDLLITDEPGVARAARGNCATVLADERYDPAMARGRASPALIRRSARASRPPISPATRLC